MRTLVGRGAKEQGLCEFGWEAGRQNKMSAMVVGTLRGGIGGGVRALAGARSPCAGIVVHGFQFLLKNRCAGEQCCRVRHSQAKRKKEEGEGHKHRAYSFLLPLI